MRIVIAGGTGFLGRPLSEALQRDGHAVTLLSRGATRATGVTTVPWTPDGRVGSWAACLDGADALVNLAGAPIAGGRWTPARKALIASSRLQATASLAAAIAEAVHPPSVFVQGSGVGYYGHCGDEVITEAAPAGHDFLGTLCVQWEAAALGAATRTTRVVCVRTGLVIEHDGGALAQMLLPFRLGVGGPLGSGRQYWPWIHRQDWVNLVRHALADASLHGPVNATAPTPVTNAAFSRALGHALHRPAVLPTPAFALRWLLGEMADALLLSGQRAVPAAAQAAGFTFRYATLEQALDAILGGR